MPPAPRLTTTVSTLGQVVIPKPIRDRRNQADLQIFFLHRSGRPNTGMRGL